MMSKNEIQYLVCVTFDTAQHTTLITRRKDSFT